MSYNPTVWQNNSGPAINAANLNKMEQGIEAAHNGPQLVVASRDATDEIKRMAHYVCNGTNDQVQVNQAVLRAAHDNTLSGTQRIGSVLLTAGRFNIGAPILMRSLVTLQGVGWDTQLEPTQSNNQAVVALAEDGERNTHMTLLCNLTIRGRSPNGVLPSAHGIHYRQAAGSYGSIAAPDAVHRIVHVNVFNMGGSGMYFEGLAGGGGRGTRVMGCRIRSSRGPGLHIDGFSDAHVEGCDINTDDQAGQPGIIAGGGNAVIQNTKVWYTGGDGILVTSGRALISSVLAQDCGQYGFNIRGRNAMLSGCVADSCSRLSTSAAGFRIAASNATLDGIKAYDRDQSENRMGYGVSFESGVRTFLTGTVTDCTVASTTGNPSSNSYIRLMTDDQGLYAVG